MENVDPKGKKTNLTSKQSCDIPTVGQYSTLYVL